MIQTFHSPAIFFQTIAVDNVAAVAVAAVAVAAVVAAVVNVVGVVPVRCRVCREHPG